MGLGPLDAGAKGSAQPVLELDDLTILTSWAEAIAEVMAVAPERATTAAASAHAGAPWRAAMGIPEPSWALERALAVIDETIGAAARAGGIPSPDAVLAAIPGDRPGDHDLDRLARLALRSAVQQRQSNPVPRRGA